MKYLPFENIKYHTKLDSEEIINRIEKIIEPKKTRIFASSDHKPYEGSINGYTFNINRIKRGRNLEVPRIKGVIEKGRNGTEINVKMRLRTFMIVFMSIWFGNLGIGCLTVLTLVLKSGIQNFEPMALIPFGMLLFGYVILTGAFKLESIKSKKYLAKLFEAEIEE